jgi:hypothetical protein
MNVDQQRRSGSGKARHLDSDTDDQHSRDQQQHLGTQPDMSIYRADDLQQDQHHRTGERSCSDGVKPTAAARTTARKTLKEIIAFLRLRAWRPRKDRWG